MKIAGIPFKSYIMNPFIIYVIAWLIVILTYSFGWSNLFPQLSRSMIAFLIYTITLSLVIGVSIQRSIVPKNIYVEPDIKKIKTLLLFSIVFVVVEFVIAGNIPMLSAMSGDSSSYTDFGIPVVHVLLINFVSFIYSYTFHCYRCVKDDKKLKRKLLFYMILAMLIFLMVFNRGAIMTCFIISGIIYLATTQNLMNSIMKFLGIFIVILFAFGVLGNLRSDTKKAKNIILTIGKATDEFKRSPIPDPFFWAYIYIASPLANFQHNVDVNTPENIHNDAVHSLVLNEWMPEILSKRLSNFFVYVEPQKRLLVKNLNVSTVYTNSYALLGWYGPILMYIFTIIFVLLNLFLVKKNSPYYLTHISILCAIIMLNIFSNMFVFMGLVPQLLFSVFLSLRYNPTRKVLIDSDQNNKIEQ